MPMCPSSYLSIEHCVDIRGIETARKRIQQYIVQTPLLTSTWLNARAGGNHLALKCENFQMSGSFKYRGACNAVLSLSEEELARGIVTHSSGNHGVALSLAASQCGCSAAVVLPHTTAASKKQAIVLNGGTLVYCEPTMESRELVCAEWQQVRGATFVPSSNSDLIIAGQGTVALEMLEQAEHLDSVIVPVSGGGLISGVAIAAKAINPNIKIYGAEPSGRNNAADAAASKAAGKLVTMESPQTIASGLQARLGSLTWPIVHELVEDIIVVNDDEIREAMYNCFKYLKVVVEPSGAAALAAACNETFIRSTQGRQNVGVILSGGNIDVEECFPLLREHSPTQQ